MHWQSLLPAAQTDLVFANAHFIVNLRWTSELPIAIGSSIVEIVFSPATSPNPLALILTMTKNNYRPVFTLALLICVLTPKLAFSQDTTSYKNKFLGRWVSYYGYRQDTIVYIPYNSPLAENISLELRYGGITFKDDNNYLDHRWKMCGNDNGPDFYPGTWSLGKLNNRSILSMIDIEKQTKKYVIIELVKNKIVLVPTQ